MSCSQTRRATNCATSRNSYSIILLWQLSAALPVAVTASRFAGLLALCDGGHSLLLASSAPGGARKRPQLRHTTKYLLDFAEYIIANFCKKVKCVLLYNVNFSVLYFFRDVAQLVARVLWEQDTAPKVSRSRKRQKPL